MRPKPKTFLKPHECIRVMGVRGKLLNHYSSNNLIFPFTTFHFQFGTATDISAIIRFFEASAIKYRVTATIDCSAQKYEMTITFQNKDLAANEKTKRYVSKAAQVDA